jgi:hypothetical protein
MGMNDHHPYFKSCSFGFNERLIIFFTFGIKKGMGQRGS